MIYKEVTNHIALKLSLVLLHMGILVYYDTLKY